MFGEFAYYMINLVQSKRIVKPFELQGTVYAFDSTTIDLCKNMFQWANFRRNKVRIKVHTLFDVKIQIPTYIHITEAIVHDVNAMDMIPYEPDAFNVFDKGYYDLARLHTLDTNNSFYIIRLKSRLKYEIIDGEKLLEANDNILYDQTI